MKRLTGILLALAIILSFVPCSFASEIAVNPAINEPFEEREYGKYASNPSWTRGERGISESLGGRATALAAWELMRSNAWSDNDIVFWGDKGASNADVIYEIVEYPENNFPESNSTISFLIQATLPEGYYFTDTGTQDTFVKVNFFLKSSPYLDNSYKSNFFVDVSYTQGEKAEAVEPDYRILDLEGYDFDKTVAFKWYDKTENLTNFDLTTLPLAGTGQSFVPPTDEIGTRIYMCYIFISTNNFLVSQVTTLLRLTVTVTPPPVKLEDIEPVKAEDEIEISVEVNEPTVVEIPVVSVKPTDVIKLVKADGTEEILPKTSLSSEGLKVELKDSATIKVVNNAKSFTDVPENSEIKEAVDFITARELFNGVSSTEFAPDFKMNRAMIATVLHRLESKPIGEKTVDFSDVEEGKWYTEAISWAAENGIVKGYNGIFDLDNNISREQLIVMLHRLAGEPEVELIDTGASNWATEAMSWAVSKGIILNNEADYKPQDAPTRAEVAQILMKYIER